MVNWTLVWQEIQDELTYLLIAPKIEPELWWIITPLIIITLIMTFYFGKYFREKMGWNTALGNSIVLIFVGIDQLRTIYNYSIPPTIWHFAWHPLTTLIIFLIMFEGIMLSATAFKHGIPEKIMYFFTSPLSINIQAYVLTIIVYTQKHPTIYTLAAALILFAIIFITLRLIQEIEHLLFGYHFKNKKNK